MCYLASHQHPQHPGCANGTMRHSQKSFRDQKVLQLAMLAFGEKPHLWFSNCLGVTTCSVDSPLLPLAIHVSSEYTVTFCSKLAVDT